MSILLSLLAGMSTKLYDDLTDNHLLKSFKNDTFMEYLKGIQYISFTTVSIDDPLFFIISYFISSFRSSFYFFISLFSLLIISFCLFLSFYIFYLFILFFFFYYFLLSFFLSFFLSLFLSSFYFFI